MKIVIIADLHDNLANLEKCLKWCRQANAASLFCCGDVTNSETLEFLAKNFSGEIFLVRGNMDLYEEKEVERYGNLKYLGRFGRLEVASRQIGLCHEPQFIKEAAKLGNCEIIFYGHTHQPWEDKNGIRLVNPGTLGGVFQKASFAVWDSETDGLELKILEFLE